MFPVAQTFLSVPEFHRIFTNSVLPSAIGAFNMFIKVFDPGHGLAGLKTLL
jgi:hypothetical protein